MGLTLNDRELIANGWADGDSPVSIAKGLSCSPGMVYTELTRGHTGEPDRNSLPMYDPELGQAVYQANLRKRGNRGRRYKRPGTPNLDSCAATACVVLDPVGWAIIGIGGVAMIIHGIYRGL